MLYSADEAVTPVTISLGIVGVALGIPALILFAVGAIRIIRLVVSGTGLQGRMNKPLTRVGRVLIEVFGHTRFWKARPVASVAHLAVMLGFMLGSVVWFESFIQVFNPASGWPFLKDWPVYHLLEEVLGVATVIGILSFVIIRIRNPHNERLSRFYQSNRAAALTIEFVVFMSGLGMLAVKAARLATFGGGNPWTDFLTIHVAKLLPASPEMVSAFALIKLLSGMVFLYALAFNLNWGIGWHRFTSFFTIFFQRNPSGERALGKLNPMVDEKGAPIDLDTVEDDTVLGTGTLADASWKMLLDSTACTECGRCQDLCPAWNTDKPLNPKLLMMDLRDAAMDNRKVLVDPSASQPETSHAGIDVLKLVSEQGPITEEVLWSCTNCGACVDQCPVDIEHIDHITDLRRFQVLTESQFPSELQGMFTNIENKGNPWGQNNSERKTWVEEARRDGIEVPVFGEDVHDFSDSEYLFWVGCAGAYDDQAKRTTRAVVELLHTAGVKFTVLATGETCTGDPARRAGNEFLFQMQAAQNIDTLDEVFDGVPEGHRKIITTCPHCFNTIRNEYPDFDGHYDVFHHTQLLSRLVRDGWLTPVPRTAENRTPITYHDPCFLGRHNQIYDPPRELLGVSDVQLLEMDKSHNEAFCCGAGGARMFMEENTGKRINEFRTEQAVATGAQEIATACPFCTNMFVGGVKALNSENAPVVKDVAVRLRDSVLVDGTLPTPRPKSFHDDARASLTITPVKKDRDAGGGSVPPGSAGPAESAPSSMPPTSVPPATGSVPKTAQPPAAPGVPGVPGVPPAPAPGAPSAPAAPSTAGVPSVPPAAPSGTGVPPAPTTPTPPAAPGAPTPPAAPTSNVPKTAQPPAAPGIPGAPGVPGVPSAPAAPGAAAVPSAPPAAPSGTGVPPAPATPTPPAAPGAPTPPAAPGVPTPPPAPTSNVPKTAQPPAAPSVPGVPSAPAPAAPSAPSAPGGTSIPPAPATPTPPAAPGAPTPPPAPNANVPKTAQPPAPPTLSADKEEKEEEDNPES